MRLALRLGVARIERQAEFLKRGCTPRPETEQAKRRELLGLFRDSSLSSFKLTDRKSTRLNSSHVRISYAVFCLKKKKKRSITMNDSIHARRPCECRLSCVCI